MLCFTLKRFFVSTIPAKQQNCIFFLEREGQDGFYQQRENHLLFPLENSYAAIIKTNKKLLVRKQGVSAKRGHRKQ